LPGAGRFVLKWDFSRRACVRRQVHRGAVRPSVGGATARMPLAREAVAVHTWSSLPDCLVARDAAEV
jgi:hypothetical protein